MRKSIIITLAVSLAVGIVSFSSWRLYLNHLRAEMEVRLSEAVLSIERGTYKLALVDAGEALALAERLRDSDTAKEIDTRIKYVEAVIRGNDLLDNGMYQAARDVFKLASDYVTDISDISSGYVEKALETTKGFIDFYALTERAEMYAGQLKYDAAITLYEEAKAIAVTLTFSEGIELVAAGLEEIAERIAAEKHAEATEFLKQGNRYFLYEQYEEAIEQYESALEIFMELDDSQGIFSASTSLALSERFLADKLLLEELAKQGEEVIGDSQDEPPPTQNEIESNHEHNLRINFNMSTLIDNQNRRPANQVRMGRTEGRNEGWYNGCGWVAAYNALLLLDDPQHPAEIVNFFETNGGTVLGGVFGTYPSAIIDYFSHLNYDTSHILFPQLTANLDNEIKKSRVAVLAYLHTSAAHYVTVEYRQDIDMFIVYNDRFARTRSERLGFSRLTGTGAAIDSVVVWLNETPEILFSFSLITVS